MGLDITGRYRYPPPDPAWLARRVEPVLDPALPIIDAHHHLWVEGSAPYLLDEFAADVSDGHGIETTIFVQAHFGYRKGGPDYLAPVGETERVVAIAAAARARGLATRVAGGIVAYADLTIGDRLDEVLDAHAAVAGPAFVGVRHSVSRDPEFPDGIVIRPAPADLLADPAYRAGLARLAARDLVYDAMLYHRQLPELAAAARAVPELRIVLDHIGCIVGVGPYEGRDADNFRVWRAGLAQVAECSNVVVKFGGLGMIVCGARWHEAPDPPASVTLAAAWQPYFDACLDLFGPERVMFESNFPVDKAMVSYRTLWNAFKRLTSGCSADERAALFAGTAADTYGIDLAEPRAVAHG